MLSFSLRGSESCSQSSVVPGRPVHTGDLASLSGKERRIFALMSQSYSDKGHLSTLDVDVQIFEKGRVKVKSLSLR